MAQYKVIQDIEAEDKLVGPLTLRQFIYAGVAVVCIYISFYTATRGAGFVMVFFLPVAAIASFFAFPWKGEQPTEIWALARLRFSIKPRVRIWDQDGAKNMVTVIAPKRVVVRRSSKEDMSQVEVRSRLKALADTIDSRGWATRNAAYGPQWGTGAIPTVTAATDATSQQMAVMMPNDDMFDDKSTVVQNFDAMLQKSQSEKRARVQQEMTQAQKPVAAIPSQPMQQQQYQPQTQQVYTQQYATPAYDTSPQLPAPLMPMPDPSQQYNPAAGAYQAPPVLPQPTLQQAQPAQNDYWFANGPAYPASPQPAIQQPQAATPQADYRIESDVPLATAATPTPQEITMGQDLKQQSAAAMAINYGHMRVLQPTDTSYVSNGIPISYQGSIPIQQPMYDDQQTTMASVAQLPSQPVTRTPDPAILDLANNDDLDIATIARQASREIDKSPDEVEIRLH